MRTTLLTMTAAWVSAVVVTLSTACSNEDSAGVGKPPAADDFPEQTTVAGATLQVGFALGRLRHEAEVEGFRITRHPVTVGDYKRCQRKGACSTPSLDTLPCTAGAPHPSGGATYSDQGDADALPVTCSSPAQAAAYCRWLGARLPTPEQWLLAARGTTVARYSHGNERPTCEQHPVAGCRVVPSERSAFFVGKHPLGVSPMGVEDVLLTPFELLRTDKESAVRTCREPNGFCVAGSEDLGAIDGIRMLPREIKAEASRSVPTFGFRCAWRAD